MIVLSARRFLTQSEIFAAAFVLHGLVSLFTLSLLTPPFQVPDEDAHFDRADQIAGGGLVGVRYSSISTSGGDIEKAIFAVEQLFADLRGHAERKLTRRTLDVAASIAWTNRAAGSFPNTAIYPPFLYLPSAFGLLVGENVKLTVPHTLLLSRLMMGLVSTALAAFAILWSGNAAAFLFTIFCLPMTLTLFASVSQDGPMIAFAGLGCAMLLQSQRRSGRLQLAAFITGCLSIALITMARPAYLPIAFIVLLPKAKPVRTRATGLALILTAALGWAAIIARYTLPGGAAAPIAAQLHAISAQPSRVGAILIHTLSTIGSGSLARQFLGVLGWLDTPLPERFYVAAGLLLAISVLVACPIEASWTSKTRYSLALSSICASIVAIFVLQYLTWTSVGATSIEGVQGRYFIPIALFLPLVLPRLSAGNRTRSVVMIGLLLFPCMSLAVTLQALVYRYHS